MNMFSSPQRSSRRMGCRSSSDSAMTSPPLKPPRRLLGLRPPLDDSPRTPQPTVGASTFSAPRESPKTRSRPPTTPTTPRASPRRVTSRLGLNVHSPMPSPPLPSPGRVGPRIPLALQAVFINNSKGAEVNECPTEAAMDFIEPVYLAERLSPQQYLEDKLNERGYSTKRVNVLDTGYYREPTPLQIASYDVHVLKMIVLHVHYGSSKGLHDVLSCGISPDACNKYGESLVHRVCKAGNKKLLQVFLDHGASVQFANDYGRTPLHEACSATKPRFDLFEQVLKRDPHLIFLTDVRGATPLSYIRMEHYDPWIRQLEAILDVYWPRRCIPKQGRQGPAPLSVKKPRSVPLPDPVNALPLKLAGLVATGKLEPFEAMLALADSCDGFSLTLEEDLSLEGHASHDGCVDAKFDEIMGYSQTSLSP